MTAWRASTRADQRGAGRGLGATPSGISDFTPILAAGQTIEDLELVVGIAATSPVPLPPTTASLQRMQAAMAHGDEALDYAAIITGAEPGAALGGLP